MDETFEKGDRDGDERDEVEEGLAYSQDGQ